MVSVSGFAMRPPQYIDGSPPADQCAVGNRDVYPCAAVYPHPLGAIPPGDLRDYPPVEVRTQTVRGDMRVPPGGFQFIADACGLGKPRPPGRGPLIAAWRSGHLVWLITRRSSVRIRLSATRITPRAKTAGRDGQCGSSRLLVGVQHPQSCG